MGSNRVMISGAAESVELGRHGLWQVRKHDGKVFLLFFYLFGLAVSYSLKFSVVSVRFIFSCASFEVQSN